MTSSGLGYGATGYDQADAEALLLSFGYPAEGVVVTGVRPDVKLADLEQNHVLHWSAVSLVDYTALEEFETRFPKTYALAEHESDAD